MTSSPAKVNISVSQEEESSDFPPLSAAQPQPKRQQQEVGESTANRTSRPRHPEAQHERTLGQDASHVISSVSDIGYAAKESMMAVKDLAVDSAKATTGMVVGTAEAALHKVADIYKATSEFVSEKTHQAYELATEAVETTSHVMSDAAKMAVGGAASAGKVTAEKGMEAKEYLGEKTTEAVKKSQEVAGDVQSKAEVMYDQAREKGGQWAEAAKRQGDHLMKTAEETGKEWYGKGEKAAMEAKKQSEQWMKKAEETGKQWYEKGEKVAKDAKTQGDQWVEETQQKGKEWYDQGEEAIAEAKKEGKAMQREATNVGHDIAEDAKRAAQDTPPAKVKSGETYADALKLTAAGTQHAPEKQARVTETNVVEVKTEE